MRCTRLYIGLASILLFADRASSVRASADARKPLVVFVAADQEYGSEETMPVFARELEKHYGMRTKVLKAYPDQNTADNIPGLEVLKEADLAIFFMRWQLLPKDQVQYFDDYLKSGKPLVAFRTSTHAFNYPKGNELERWNAFGSFALGAPPGWGGDHFHYGHESSTDVTYIPAARKNPILKGVETSFHVRSWLYHTLPKFPPPDANALLMGKSVNPDKAATDNPVAWTWKNGFGGRVFVTTMGHPEDFRVESVQRLVINGIHWALGKRIPDKWAGKIDFQVPYRGVRTSPAHQ